MEKRFRVARGALDWFSSSQRTGRSLLFHLGRSGIGRYSQLGDWMFGHLPGLSSSVDTCQFRDLASDPMDVGLAGHFGGGRPADHVGCGAS